MPFCPSCGRLVPDPSPNFCPNCGKAILTIAVAQQSAIRPPKKSILFAVVVGAIIPGMGQIYVGKEDRGLGILFLMIALWVATFLTAFILIPVIIAVYLLQLIDAFLQTMNYNKYVKKYGTEPW